MTSLSEYMSIEEPDEGEPVSFYFTGADVDGAYIGWHEARWHKSRSRPPLLVEEEQKDA